MTGLDRKHLITLAGYALMTMAGSVNVGAVRAETSSSACLTPVAESTSMIWNAVAVDGQRIFVSGPRWAGAKGLAVALINASGGLAPYPDSDWNSWKPGADASKAFVNANALHRDTEGNLWVIDTGAPAFGGDPLSGGAKAVRIDLETNRVERVYPLGPTIAKPGSYVDDIRFNGNHAYLTDAGRPGLIVLDLKSGDARRVLDGAASVTAPPDRPIVVDGQIVRAPDGPPLKVNSDPLETSPDGRYLYFGSLHGPWSRIETRLLDDASVPESELIARVEPWADLPPVGGTAMASDGALFFSDLASNAVKKRVPDGTITTLIQDPQLHWVDAPFLDGSFIWLPAAQLDRLPLFNGGVSKVQWPIRLYRCPAALQPTPKG